MNKKELIEKIVKKCFVASDGVIRITEEKLRKILEKELIEKIVKKCFVASDGVIRITEEKLRKILEKHLPEDNEGDVVEKKDRYYLVGPDGWIFSSDKKEECIDFKNNMIQSKRFAVGKIKSLIVVDIEDLGKYSSD